MWPSSLGSGKLARRSRLGVEQLETRTCMDCTISVPAFLGDLMPSTGTPEELLAFKVAETDALSDSVRADVKQLKQEIAAIKKAQKFLQSGQYDELLQEAGFSDTLGEHLLALNARAKVLLSELRSAIPELIRDEVIAGVIPFDQLNQLTEALETLPTKPGDAFVFLADSQHREGLALITEAVSQAVLAAVTGPVKDWVFDAWGAVYGIAANNLLKVKRAEMLLDFPDVYELAKRVYLYNRMDNMLESLGELTQIHQDFDAAAGIALGNRLQMAEDRLAHLSTLLTTIKTSQVESQAEIKCVVGAKYDGTYTGTFDGSVTYTAFGQTQTDQVGGGVNFTISGGVITVTAPAGGSGSINPKGTAGFTSGSGALGIQGATVRYGGALTIHEDGSVTGDGWWRCSFNIDGVRGTAAGNWNASRS